MPVRTYVVFAVSVLRCMMQVYPLSQAVLKCEGNADQQLIAGPRFAFTRVMCTRPRDLGRNLEFPDLSHVSIAAQVRLAHRFTGFGKMKMLLDNLVMKDMRRSIVYGICSIGRRPCSRVH